MEEFLVTGPEYLKTLFFRCLKTTFLSFSKACRVFKPVLGCMGAPGQAMEVAHSYPAHQSHGVMLHHLKVETRASR